MRFIVEEQSVQSPPALPTQSQHTLGVNQLLGEPRGNIHPQKVLRESHPLKCYRTWESSERDFLFTDSPIPKQYFKVEF